MYIPRKSRTTTYVRKGSKGVRRKLSGRKQVRRPVPSRLIPSRTRTAVSREVAKQINSVAENKFVGRIGDCLAPIPKPGVGSVAKLNYCLFNSGEALPTGVSTDFTPMKCFTYPAAERDGRYLYLKHALQHFEIQMLPRDTNSTSVLNSTTQFRFMVVKQKQYTNRLGTVSSPNSSLFLAPDNKEFGLSDLAATNIMYSAQPINRRNWTVYQDKRFTLTAPSATYFDSTGATEQSVNVAHEKYPVKRSIKFKLPVSAKILYGTGDIPIDIDTQWLVIIQAMPTSYCADTADAQKQWRVNYLSTTVANDS